MTELAVTTWIRGMKLGDSRAERQLWSACWGPVVERARAILAKKHRSVSDEEDVAAAVLATVIRRAQAGEFPALNNSNELWRLLWVIVERKVANLVEHDRAQCRDLNRTRQLAATVDRQVFGSSASMEQLADNSQPEPFESLALVETFEQLMKDLSPVAKRTVEMALEGRRPSEIATALGVKVWTIYGHLAHVRSLLESGSK